MNKPELTARVVLCPEEAEVAKTEIWIGTIEIGWSEQKTPTVFQPAFTVVTTWAASPEERRAGSCGFAEPYAGMPNQ